MRVLSQAILLFVTLSCPSYSTALPATLEEFSTSMTLTKTADLPLEPYIPTIIDEYEDNSKTIVSSNRNKTTTNKVPSLEDYERTDADPITLTKLAPKKEVGLLIKTGQLLAYGSSKIVEHTARITLGCISNHYFNEIAYVVFGKGLYVITLYFTGNPYLANAASVVGGKACQPIVASVVFYVGVKSLDIVYHGIQGIIKSVQLTHQSGKLLFRGTKFTVKYITGRLQSEEGSKEMIELALMNHPDKPTQ
jgi:hypothetical protein